MRIWVFGATGQVGSALIATAKDMSYDIRSIRRAELDVADVAACAAWLDQQDHQARPDVVINAAAYTAVDLAEQQPDLADRINHHWVAQLAAWCAYHQVLLVHYSTDYVFDGKATRPYTEQDQPAPLNVYGNSKWQGEQAIAAAHGAHLIVRTSGVYDADHANFLTTMLRLSQQHTTLKVVHDQQMAPTAASRIACITWAMLTRWQSLDDQQRKQAHGIYHMSAQGQTSWYDYARWAIAQLPHTTLEQIIPIGSHEWKSAAQRPQFSCLNSQKLRQVFGLSLPFWQDDVQMHVAIWQKTLSRTVI